MVARRGILRSDSNPATEDTMYLYQHNHTEDGTETTDYYSVPEDDCSPVRPEDEERDAELARTR